MTDTELRAACRQFLKTLRCYVPGAWQLDTQEQLDALNLLEQQDIDLLLRFAQRQRAETWRMAAEKFKGKADDSYCRSLNIAKQYCCGMQVLHKFSVDEQQAKLKRLEESAGLDGRHRAYADVCRECQAQAAQAEKGAI